MLVANRRYRRRGVVDETERQKNRAKSGMRTKVSAEQRPQRHCRFVDAAVQRAGCRGAVVSD